MHSFRYYRLDELMLQAECVYELAIGYVEEHDRSLRFGTPAESGMRSSTDSARDLGRLAVPLAQTAGEALPGRGSRTTSVDQGIMAYGTHGPWVRCCDRS